MIRNVLVVAMLWVLTVSPASASQSLRPARPRFPSAATRFYVNGRPTYEGRTWKGMKIEGLLLNARLVQGIFDDMNPETVGKWAYPDTGRWDPERNTREFVAAMPEWRRHGLLCFTINLQGGSPQGYSKDQPWHNSAITPEGTLRPGYMRRLEKILDRADELGMVVILGVFYFGQDERLRDEAAVERAVDAAVDWVYDHGYRNVMMEVNNECNVRYDHAILRPERVHELIERVKQHKPQGALDRPAGRPPAAPGEHQLRRRHRAAGERGAERRLPADARQRRERPQADRRDGPPVPPRARLQPMPILFNEDDHFDFDKPHNNMTGRGGRVCQLGLL